MLIDHEEIDKRLASTDNLLNRIKPIPKSDVTVLPNRKPRTDMATDIPEEVREMIGATVRAGATTREVGAAFGVSHNVASDASLGLTGDRKNDVLTEALNKKQRESEEKKESAHELALDAMVAAIGGINLRLQDVTDPVKLSKIASDMSKITANLKPVEKDVATTSNIKVVVFAPQIRQEKYYDVLELSKTG